MSFRSIFILVIISMTIPRLHADESEDEWFQRKLEESYKASKEAYHHDPVEVIDHFNYHVNK